jgi:crotonobetainyl-CoA:carnitine CoA-transferase CaiB-like acyl-CoA transferase
MPSLPVNTVADLFAHPHYQERGTFVDVEHPYIGRYKTAGPPYRLSETPVRIASPAPSLGQHNEEIICGKLGFSKEDLVKMRQMGII